MSENFIDHISTGFLAGVFLFGVVLMLIGTFGKKQ